MTLRWIREKIKGYKGGEYFHLNKGSKWVDIRDLEVGKVEVGSDEVVYAVDTDDSNEWISVDFSSNPNNRHFYLRVYKHGDFQKQKPSSYKDYNHPDPVNKYLLEEKDPKEILKSLKRTKTFKRYQKTIEKIRPEVKKLFSNSEHVRASPGAGQALESPMKFFVSAAGQGRGGTKSIGNVKKKMLQAYEVEALREGLEARVIVKGGLSRRWSTGGLPPGDGELEVPINAIERLGIGFGRPNFILSTDREKYSIWLEFSLTRYCRPDLFVLRGKHDSAFLPTVREYLNEYNEEFYRKVPERWRKEIAKSLSEFLITDREIKPKSREKVENEPLKGHEIKNFVKGLAEHLKEGVVIESKERAREKKKAEDQIQRYRQIFKNQKIVLLTWFNWNKNLPSDIEVLDNFGVDKESKNRIASLIKESF